MTCQAAGAACVDTGDCAAGASCTDGVCVRAGDCVDALDCAPGFFCEAGTCVDHRVSCMTQSECPRGFRCRPPEASGGSGVCVPSHRRCVNDGACPAGWSCLDIDGDGDSECQFDTGTCVQHSDCADGELCGIADSFLLASCGTNGPCIADGDCGGSDRCLSIFGPDVRVCVPATGSCTSVSDCAVGELCGVAAGSASLECLP
ncbi:MAG: hypothetical protein GWN07_33190 [Actinobacteria bacterium]|nr:hypothetical protein [Actinomycetota bacterium]NIS35651.1 hypothetical protein [Actinomycetota bacterium]NIU70303.1 hypothetical protein [Actinomycetota bacterium]NIW32182.1 hypothetical protein [Actinomycetota bacterium]NIX24403.1 hypothetical protein [Actinomycetota bacterium]